jgi:hypothetical protein
MIPYQILNSQSTCITVDRSCFAIIIMHTFPFAKADYRIYCLSLAYSGNNAVLKLSIHLIIIISVAPGALWD